MGHFKFMGWLWMLLGIFWSVLVSIAVITTTKPFEEYATMSRFAWWENLISEVLEVAIFVGSAICGLALLRGWRCSRPMTWTLGGIWFVFSIMFIWNATGRLAERILWFGPPLVLAIYSFIVLAFVKQQTRKV
jgi:hypothetical protein